MVEQHRQIPFQSVQLYTYQQLFRLSSAKQNDPIFILNLISPFPFNLFGRSHLKNLQDFKIRLSYKKKLFNIWGSQEW